MFVEALRECSGHFLFTGCHTSRPTMLSQTKVSKVSPLLSHPLKSQSLSQKTPALLTQFEMDKVECIWGFLRKQTSFEANIGHSMLPWKESSEGTSTSCLPVATTRASSQWGQSVPFSEHRRLGWSRKTKFLLLRATVVESVGGWRAGSCEPTCLWGMFEPRGMIPVDSRPLKSIRLTIEAEATRNSQEEWIRGRGSALT